MHVVKVLVEKLQGGGFSATARDESGSIATAVGITRFKTLRRIRRQLNKALDEGQQYDLEVDEIGGTETGD